MLDSSLLLFSFSVFNVLYVRSLSDFEVNEEAATPQQEVCFHSKPVLIILVTLGMNGMFSLLLHHSRSFLCSPIIHLFTQAVPNIRLFSLSLYIQRIFLFVISLEPWHGSAGQWDPSKHSWLLGFRSFLSELFSMQHHGDVCTHNPGQFIAESHLSALFHQPICPSGSSVGQSPAGPPLSGGFWPPQEAI